LWGSAEKAAALTLVRETFGFVATLGLWALYRRAPIGLGRPMQLAVVVMALGLGLAFLEAWCCGWLEFVSRPPSSPGLLRLGTIYFRGLLYSVWGMLYFWIRERMRDAARMRALAEAEARAQRAELLLLKAQANPHFLFNAFNTILAGLEGEPKALQPMVQGLADYLRYSLRHREKADAPLSEEFDAAANYLAVEKARFGADLETECRLGPAARDSSVPAVLVQPLIENAVKHGMKTSPMPLRVSVTADMADDGRVCIEVTNSGEWIEPAAGGTEAHEGGHGLGILRRRLGILYGDRHAFDVEARHGEVRVRVMVPRMSAMEGPA
jgi:LytS/YehU family sensor histidine kinase